MKLTKDQQRIFQKWGSHARFSYNTALALLQGQYKATKKYDSKMSLRDKVTPADVNTERKWILETPKDIRADAVFNAHQNITTAIKQIQNKTIKHFKVHYKRKKSLTWSICIPKSAIKILEKSDNVAKKKISEIKIYQRYIKDPIELLTKKDEIISINHDCKVHFDGEGYYLIVPYTQTINNQDDDSRKFVVSCDPGEKTFLTSFDEEGNALNIGVNFRSYLEKYQSQIDSLKQRISLKQSKKKRRDKKKVRTLYRKIKNLMTDFHHKTGKFLATNYKTIVIPHFNTKNQMQKSKLNKVVKRSISSLSHCKFIERLKTKALQHNCNVIDWVNERYTTQCCGNCGHLNKNIGGLREYECPSCHHYHDRDVNAARNIMFKIFGKEVSIDQFFTNSLTTQFEGALGLKSLEPIGKLLTSVNNQ